MRQHRAAADPLAFTACRGHLVPRAFGDDLALELGEAEEDVECQTPDRVRRIELLRYRNEADAGLIEDLDDPGKVEQRSAQAVNFVDLSLSQIPK